MIKESVVAKFATTVNSVQTYQGDDYNNAAIISAGYWDESY